MRANDPAHEVSDDEFEEMVQVAEAIATCDYLIECVGKRRMSKILAFAVPLEDITTNELAAHFQYVMSAATAKASE